MLTTITINGGPYEVAQWLHRITRQMEQDHNRKEFVPFAPDFTYRWRTQESGPYCLYIGTDQGPESRSQNASVSREEAFLIFTFLSFGTSYIPQKFDLQIEYKEEFEQYETADLPGFFREYLQAIINRWPSTRRQIRDQLRAIPAFLSQHPKFNDLADLEATDGKVEGARASFGPKRRARADLFKRLKETFPNATQEQIASRAGPAAQREIEEELLRQSPPPRDINNAIFGIMNERYGQTDFELHTLQNDWRDMKKVGEVGPWKRSNTKR